MIDLTCIFLTVNKVPAGWAKYHRQVLTEAIGESPIITISRVPMDWGTNLIQDGVPSVDNIYRQILRGAKLATTKYIAIAEDDTLYHRSHFEFRPPEDTFGYDYHRFGLFTWGKPTYYYKDRISNASLIAPRELVVKSLEERFKYYSSNRISELGNEKGTQLERYKMKFFYSEVAMVYFSHIDGLDPTEQHKTKKMSPIQAYDIPYWNKAEDLVKRWWE
jgi:hypothetical protein